MECFSLPEREEQQTPRTDEEIRVFLLETEGRRRKQESLKVPVLIVLDLFSIRPLIII